MIPSMRFSSRRGARLAVVGCAAAFVAIAMACADKGLVGPVRYAGGKALLQVTVTSSQQVSGAARWLLVAVVVDKSNSNNNGNNNGNGSGNNDVIGYHWAPYTQGSQTVTVEADLARCTALSDGGVCKVDVGAAIRADSICLECRDSTKNGGDPLVGAFDAAFPIGPYVLVAGRAPTIPTIDLSESRFAIREWQPDEGLRIGGNNVPIGLTSALNGAAPIAGVPNGSGAPTLYALTQGIDSAVAASAINANNGQFPNAYPQLAVFQNGSWRRVTATAAPSLNTGNQGSFFNDVTALSTSEVYVSSPSGLYKYDGTAISKVAQVTDSMFSVASVVSGAARYVIAGGQSGSVWVSNTQTWTRYSLPTSNHVDGVCITGPSEAFASTFNGGGLFKFDGTSWISVPAPFSGNRIDLQCPAPGQAFVQSTNGGAMFRWAGTGWTQIPSTGIGSGRAIRWGAASASEIWAWADSTVSGTTGSVSADRVFYNFNGTTWKEIGRLRFTFASGGRMWVPPGGGSAYVASSALGRVEKVTLAGASVVSYQPDLRDVIVTSPTSAFVVGRAGFLARWDGVRWNADAPPPNTPTSRLMQRVWSDGPGNAWAVGNSSTVWQWNGSAWSTVSDSPRPIATSDNYWGVWGSGSDVWAVGDNTILHCRSVSNCTNESSAGSGALLAVWGTSPSNVFAVGDGGRIVHYNGTAWASMSSPTSRALARVYGSGTTDVWAIGDSVVIHYDGSTWSLKSINGDLRGQQMYVPTPAERAGQVQGSVLYVGIVGLGLWVRDSNQVYIGTGNYPTFTTTTSGSSNGNGSDIVRGTQYGWNSALKNNGTPLGNRRFVGLSGIAAGCGLAVVDARNDNRSFTLLRGIGPGCFGAPMAPPTSWP